MEQLLIAIPALAGDVVEQLSTLQCVTLMKVPTPEPSAVTVPSGLYPLLALTTLVMIRSILTFVPDVLLTSIESALLPDMSP